MISRHFLKQAKSSFSVSKYCYSEAFYRKDLKTTITKNKKPQPKHDSNLKFGEVTTDHLLEIDWNIKTGWATPQINPYHTFSMDPCNSTLHYGLECFEGFKVFYNSEGKLQAFRPEMNMKRMLSSVPKVSLPTFDPKEFLECIRELIKVDRDWVPNKEGFSMYVRPTAIAMTDALGVRAPDNAKLFCVLNPVGPYFPDGFKPLKILIENQYSRSYPGGVGSFKLGSNYAPTIAISAQAEKRGFHQILWLTNRKITEIGASNFLFVWHNENGEKELVSPPRDELILPGVTLDSVLQLARKKKGIKVVERETTIDELIKAAKEKRLVEAFGAGTAVTIGPVKSFHFEGVDYDLPLDPKTHSGPLTKEISEEIKAIQYGKVKHDWNYMID